jgi:hypothetical protein
VSETRKIAAMLLSNVVRYSQLWERTRIARCRGFAGCAVRSSKQRPFPEALARCSHTPGPIEEVSRLVAII